MSNIKYFYIKKNGLYYRPNSCGYTERRFWAGVYTEEEIKDHKGCDELTFVEINVEEHNQILRKEIETIKSNLIVT